MDEVTPEGLSDVEYGKKLRIIDDKINDLTDSILDNDKQAKEAIGNIMDEAFLNGLKTYFKNPEHKNELNKFVEGICSVLYKALDDFRKANPGKDFSEFSSQFKFLGNFVKEIADKLGIRKEITDKIKAITDEFGVNVTGNRDIQVNETVANESDAVVDTDNNRGFNIVDNIETNIDTERINAYICSKIGSDKDIIRGTKDGYKCNMQNVKEFLSKITSGEIPFDRNFVAKNSDSRMAWITAVQLMLNAEDGDKIKVDGKFGPKTSNRVKAFQEKYNSTVQNGEAELAVDGIPGKNTMKALLGEKPEVPARPASTVSETPASGTSGAETQRNQEMTLSDLKSLGGYNMLNIGSFNGNNNFKFKPGIEKTDSKGRKYIEINGKRMYELENNKNGIYYYRFKHGFCFGQHKNGKLNGLGSAIWSHGEKYTGYFKDDKKEGKGCLINKHGDRYDGQLKNGVYEGQGTYKFKDGSKWTGLWKNGKIWTCAYYAKDGKTVLEKWENGKKVYG